MKINPEDVTVRLLDEFESVQRQKLQASLTKFEVDFEETEEPITEFLLRVSEHDFIRSENIDYEDKDYMLVN